MSDLPAASHTSQAAVVPFNYSQWEEVNALIQKSRNGTPGIPRLIIVCFCTPWNPTSRFTARVFDEIRSGLDARYSHIAICNAEAELRACHAMTIHATPAVQFYWDGQLMTIRRPDWDDDTKFVGTNSKETWLELIRYAREAGTKGSTVLSIPVA